MQDNWIQVNLPVKLLSYLRLQPSQSLCTALSARNNVEDYKNNGCEKPQYDR